MEIRRIESFGALVITPSHDLSLEAVPPVSEAVQVGLRSEVGSVIVDMRAVEHIDSSGISALVKGHQTAGKLEKRFFLVRLRPNVRRVFRLSNLHKVFDIFPSLDDVLFTLEGHRVLVWDDRKSVVDFYEELLTANGFTLIVACDLGEAERILRQDKPSLVILDVQEDDEGKYGFVRSVCVGEAVDRRTPVVVVSSFLEEEAAYIDAGVSLFVSKPFRVEGLVRQLRTLART